MGSKHSSIVPEAELPSKSLKTKSNDVSDKTETHLKVNVQQSSPKTPEQNNVPGDGQTASDHIMALIDPRSPTIEYSRTPIQVIEERNRKEKARIARLLKAKAEGKEIPDDDTTPATTTNNSLNVADFLDPRSPNAEIQRTPLALGEKNSSNDGDTGYKSSEKDPKVESPKIPSSAVRGLSKDLRKRLFISQNKRDSLNNENETDETDKENEGCKS